MWFNGKSLSERRPYESRKFAFTDKECREMESDGTSNPNTYTDSLCKNLKLFIYDTGYNSYVFHNKYGTKVIGSVFSISIKEAREIVKNIKDNMEEYKQELPNIKTDLFTYLKRNGFFPHQPKGTEAIISDENASLKQKIKDLQAENESLKAEIQKISEENRKYHSRLMTIKKVVSEVYEDNTETVD